MSAKTMSSLTDEQRNLRKQIGCMNGIFQLFDRHHFLTGRRLSGHHKRLLQGAQHQLDPKYAGKVVMEKGLEAQKEKPRISTESSRASYSSSSCSSTFSSLDFNRIAQPETLSHRQKNNPKSPSIITATKESQSLDLRDVVKDSMYREARGLSIKSLAKDERKGTVMKHIDSPRPLQQSKPKTPKTIFSESTTRVLPKDERLSLPRFSYDGRESQDKLKWAVKHKELPRLSLDSKASSMKCYPHDSRLNFLGREPRMENENSSHSRTSSVVAKLMGLETFSATISTDESRTPTIKSSTKEAFLSLLTSTAELSKQNQVTYSPRVSQINPSSPSPRFHSANLARKANPCSRFPIEPAPWRQQDSGQESPKIASNSRKAPTNTGNLSSSVYGEIEKRITDLQFQKSGKDLRALKQILEAMKKTRERLEDGMGNNSFSDQNSKQLRSSVVIFRPPKVMDKVELPISNRVPTMEMSNQQGLQTRNPKYHTEKSAHRQKTKYLTPKNNNLPSTHKKTSWGNSEPQRKKVENCTTPGRSFGTVSPRLQQNLLRTEGQSHRTTQSADSGGVKKHGRKKLTEKGSQNRKHQVKAKDMHLSDDQLRESSNETYSSYQDDAASVISDCNNSIVSQPATEVISLAHSINTKARYKENYVSTTRELMPAVDIIVTMTEQPSPISVLDDTFYCENSPSPVKKISTAFQDESTGTDEEEWHLENLNYLTDCTRSNHACKYDQNIEVKNSVCELTLLTTEPDETALEDNAFIHTSSNPDHRYINKILLTSGLLKDSSFISTTDQLSACNLINPDMFHVLEQTEEFIDGTNEEVRGKNDKMQLNKKIQRKIIFDMVDEILVRKMTSGKLLKAGNKKTSPAELLKEVCLEMDRVCRIPECNLDDEEDEMIKLLTADMKYQSDDWIDYSGEVPALVLDIERMIFKELVNEVVTGEITGLHDWPKRHCRKLFH